MITITQGNVLPNLQFTIKSNGVAVDLSGASFSTKIRGPGGVVKTFANDQHTADPDQEANTGKFTIDLSAEDTASLADTSHLPETEGHEVVTTVTQGSSTISYRKKNILRVEPADPIPLE